MVRLMTTSLSLQIIAQISEEIGDAPDDEWRRMRLFRQLRKEKDDHSARRKLKKQLEHELDSEDDIWKNGTVVKRLAAAVGVAFLGIFLVVMRDLDLEPAKKKSAGDAAAKKNE